MASCLLIADALPKVFDANFIRRFDLHDARCDGRDDDDSMRVKSLRLKLLPSFFVRLRGLILKTLSRTTVGLGKHPGSSSGFLKR
jgi:hypothetical protein